MTNIADLSDEPKYNIKAVASLTGIRPVTLRAWERRHEVLTPHRSNNHYRLYSEQDIAILKWVKSEVDNGISISNVVSKLRNLTSQDLWPEAISATPSQQHSKSTEPPSVYPKKLYTAFLKHDEAAASDLLKEVFSSFDLITVFTQILCPTLVEIGDAWYNGRIRIATEHFASAFLRGKLLTLFQAYPARRNAAYIIIGCAPTEQHELGGLMLAVLLRSMGYNVEYLGPDIPIDDLVDYASYEHPKMIILSAVTVSAALELKSFQTKLNRLRNAPIFSYGGFAFDVSPKLIEQIPGNYLGNNFELAAQSVRNLLSNDSKISSLK